MQSPFPVRSDRKPSYSAAPVVWIKQSGIQSDIQKVLRHARKLPEKTTQFYKELNRLQKAAVCMGWEINLLPIIFINGAETSNRLVHVIF